MSFEKFVDVVAEVTDRRRFLRKLGILTLGATAGALGIGAETAAAGPLCCNLCRTPSSSCTGCACRWSWTCCHRNGISGILYQCGECFSSSSCGGCCTGSSCNQVKCSWMKALNYCV